MRIPALAAFTLFTLLAGEFWRDLIGWGGYLALALALAVVLAIVTGKTGGWKKLRLWRLPKSLVLFMLLALVSLAWSFYPGATALGLLAMYASTIAAVFLVTTLSWPALLTALGRATRWTVALSLLFELIVGLFVRQPVLPFWVHYDQAKVPDAFYWSLGSIFHGGPIQGIVANRNLLAFAAVIAALCVALEFASRLITRNRAIVWLVLIVATLGLTRSVTAIAALAVGVVALGVLLATRRLGPGGRAWLLTAVTIALVGAGILFSIFSKPILAVFGKSSDFTGRVEIWNSVTALAVQRPAFGWGWVSYWAPWAEPFSHLAERKGVVYLQAHSAWIDVWFQLGVVGLILFIAVVVGTAYRAWWFAVDPQRDNRGRLLPYLPVTLLPPVLLAILVTQSFVESRMLIEGGWALLVVLAVKTKFDSHAVDLALEAPPLASQYRVVDPGFVPSDRSASAPVGRQVGLPR